MRNRIIGAIGLVAGALIVIGRLNTLMNSNTLSGYGLSNNLLLFFGASLCLVGLYYLVRRAY